MFRFFTKKSLQTQAKATDLTHTQVRPATHPRRQKRHDPYFQVKLPAFSEINDFNVRLKTFRQGPYSLDRHKLRFYYALLTRQIDPYKTILAPKKNGSTRHLSCPPNELRHMSSWFLREHLNEEQLYHPRAFAYVRGKSAVQCAKEHVEAKWIIKIDIQDFFHTIDERMVFWALQGYGATRYRAFFLARMLTRLTKDQQDWLPAKYKVSSPSKKGSRFRSKPSRLGFLPQGLPTSGAISNLVCYAMDVRLSELATGSKLTYTRYADDIIFSSTDDFDRLEAEQALRSAIAQIERFGFAHNKAKTRIIPPGARKLILGVLVGNGHVRLTKKTRQNIDQTLWAIEKFGVESHAEHLGAFSPGFLLNQLTGKLLWAKEVDEPWAQVRLERLQNFVATLLTHSKINGFELNEFTVFEEIRKNVRKSSSKARWKFLASVTYSDALQIQIRVKGNYHFLQLEKTGTSKTWVGTWKGRWVESLGPSGRPCSDAFTLKIAKTDDQALSRSNILASINKCFETLPTGEQQGYLD